MCFVIYTAGFKEIGEEGKKIEEQLAQIAHDAGVTLLGPNCLGFLHTPSKVNASFAQAHMTPGNLRIVSQSGAVASALFDRAQAVSLRFETCVTIGNKAVLDETHFLSWWTEQQDHTGPIGLYLEEISNGDMFMKYSSELTQQ